MLSPRLPRRGLSTLVAVLVLLAILVVTGLIQHDLSRRSVSEVHRIQLSTLARVQARAAIQEMLSELQLAVNDSESPVFRRIREVIDDRWEVLDLTDLVAAPESGIEPAWGKAAGERPEGSALARIVSHSARIRGTRSSRDIGGTEEWTGVLTLGAVTEISDAAARMRREVEESFEIRTVLIGPPRPFDQLGIYLGDMRAVTQPAQANTLRFQLIDGQDRLVKEVAASDPGMLTAADQQRLGEIAAGILPTEEVARRTPVLPEGPTTLMGFYHVARFPLEDLDLERVLKREKESVDTAVSRLRAVKGDPSRIVEAVYQAADAYSNALNQAWSYQRTLTLVPHGSPAHASMLGPYLPRLEPEHFLDRVTLKPGLEDRPLVEWLAGRSRLEGVVDLTDASANLGLTGELRGRVMLLVGKGGAHLEDLNWRAVHGGHRLVVVSLGGDVTVAGEVAASILMLPVAGGGPETTGTIRIGHGAVLRGGLLVPHASRSRLQLEGAIEYDPNLLASYPPKETLNRPFRGEYVVSVSPDPLFSEGRAR